MALDGAGVTAALLSCLYGQSNGGADFSKSRALEAVTQFEKCTDLELNRLAIDDVLSTRLEKLTQLKTLSIYDPNYDYDAIERLRMHMPKCDITIREIHIDYIREHSFPADSRSLP